MSAPQITMIPEGSFSIKDLDRFLFELEARWKAKEVLHTKEAAAYLGISKATLYKIPKSVIPFHQIEGLEGRLYLRSEIHEKIKKS